jgi:hypothetical protein
MKSKKSRLALVGVLALAITVVVGLASGSVADAKKKKKGGGGKGGSVTATSAGPTTVPLSTPPPPITPDTVTNRGVANIPLTIGKKGKNKVVNSVSLSYTITGSPRTGAGTVDDTPAAASQIGLELIAPNGGAVGGLDFCQGDENATQCGPTTVTTFSPFGVCSTTETGTDGTTTICDVNDPDGVVKPPTYAGTVGDIDLSGFSGVPAKGTWTLRARNFSRATTAAIANVALRLGLSPA